MDENPFASPAPPPKDDENLDLPSADTTNFARDTLVLILVNLLALFLLPAVVILLASIFG